MIGEGDKQQRGDFNISQTAISSGFYSQYLYHSSGNGTQLYFKMRFLFLNDRMVPPSSNKTRKGCATLFGVGRLTVSGLNCRLRVALFNTVNYHSLSHSIRLDQPRFESYPTSADAHASLIRAFCPTLRIVPQGGGTS